jgi:hypothetical protein
MFIPNSSKGATVIMESWGPAGITLGSQVSSPTCHRHSGTYYDVDYVHHEDGNEAQVNSKPIEETRAKPRLPDWAN